MAYCSRVIYWVNRVSVVAGIMTATLFLGLTVLVAANVVTRPFGHPIAWTEEMTRFFLVWGVMLSMALALQEGKHIRVTVLVRKLTPKKQKIIELFMDLIAIAVLTVFVFQGYKFSVFTKALGEISQGALDYPIWWAETALPIGGGLFVLQYLIKCLKDLLAVVNRDLQDSLHTTNQMH